MNEIIITADILCDWPEGKMGYRVYVDEDLLTERTYIWRNNEQLVREHIIVNLEPGTHTLKIESANPKFKGFSYKNVTVNKQPVELVNNQFVI